MIWLSFANNGYQSDYRCETLIWRPELDYLTLLQSNRIESNLMNEMKRFDLLNLELQGSIFSLLVWLIWWEGEIGRAHV